MVTFDTLLTCVKFDFIPLEDIEEYLEIDTGFTDTDAWNENFNSLGYDSSNFFLCLGSISIFIMINIILVVVSALVYCCSIKVKNQWLKSKIDPTQVKSGLIRFFLEIYFELLLASLLIIKAREYKTYFTLQDKLSFWCQRIG